MADYATKPTKAKEDAGIIELRKRMLAVFLNRCRRMREVLEDGVWWRFLDPNVSWVRLSGPCTQFRQLVLTLCQNEVLNTPPVSNIPKNVLKAPPLDTSNPSTAHSYLPVPASSSRLKSSAGNMSSSVPTSPIRGNSSVVTATIPPSSFNRFPPSAAELTEEELDPYFINFESSSKDLENLLQGSMEKSNRRMLSHYASLSEDLMELGARFNAFSLSEQSPTLANAIEKTGQASDNTYMLTNNLSGDLSATFSEPMRESAQFAGVVRSVLRYRVMKRVQEEMTKDELDKKRALLASLKDQEEQSQRMGATLNNYGGPATPRRATSSATRSSPDRPRHEDDVASIDSDFPPTHGDAPPPSANQGVPDPYGSNHKKSTSGNFISNKIFGRISHAFQGVVDSDPVKTRQDMIGKTSEQVKQVMARKS
jgi:hypothetical protein